MGRHLVRLLVRLLALGLRRTRHRVRWHSDRIVLAGHDGGGMVLDIGAGTVAVEGAGAWTALAEETVEKTGLTLSRPTGPETLPAPHPAPRSPP